MPEPSATLLIIDDDEVVRASIADYLEDSGFKVVQAGNGKQGWQLYRQWRPDLVICDLRMPHADGMELIRNIIRGEAVAESPSQEPADSETPVIVFSGAGVMSDALESLRLGASDYLVKPLEDMAVLEHAVRKALDRARLKKENARYRDRLEAANRELQASLELLQEDQNAGRQLQLSMLPQTPWKEGKLRFAHHILPSLYLSGDFVDYFKINHRKVAFYLADVSGHGASSAFVTVLLKFTISRLLYKYQRFRQTPEFQPSEILAYANRELVNCNLGKHATIFGGVIDVRSNLLTYSCGGHLPLPVLYSQGQASYLQGGGLPVGLFEEASYQDHQLELPESFSLTLSSDGILSLLPGASLQDKEAALPRLVEQAEGRLGPLESLLGLGDLAERTDDIALLVINRSLA